MFADDFGGRPKALAPVLDALGVAPEHMLFVGDTQHDLQCAGVAGTGFAWAGWNPRVGRPAGVAPVLEAPADLIGAGPLRPRLRAACSSPRLSLVGSSTPAASGSRPRRQPRPPDRLTVAAFASTSAVGSRRTSAAASIARPEHRATVDRRTIDAGSVGGFGRTASVGSDSASASGAFCRLRCRPSSGAAAPSTDRTLRARPWPFGPQGGVGSAWVRWRDRCRTSRRCEVGARLRRTRPHARRRGRGRGCWPARRRCGPARTPARRAPSPNAPARSPPSWSPRLRR